MSDSEEKRRRERERERKSGQAGSRICSRGEDHVFYCLLLSFECKNGKLQHKLDPSRYFHTLCTTRFQPKTFRILALSMYGPPPFFFFTVLFCFFFLRKAIIHIRYYNSQLMLRKRDGINFV